MLLNNVYEVSLPTFSQIRSISFVEIAVMLSIEGVGGMADQVVFDSTDE